ncbi:MAG: hypothetical protein U9Q81_14385 [Pseudomonadota bacterium]|nr:hypothetical protein [Pseudomonadota bacterium]
MTADTGIADIDGDEDEIDGCDIEFHDAESTRDDELPMAVGGLEFRDEEDDADGCDVDFDDIDATLDEDLPAAEGGVA